MPDLLLMSLLRPLSRRLRAPMRKPAGFRPRLAALSLSLLLALSLWGVAAVPVSAQIATEQPSGTITVSDNAAQDAAIARRIRDILGELDGYDDISVTVTSGIVTLRGITPDAATTTRLDELVSRVEGVVAIENEVAETTDVAERLSPLVDRLRERIATVVSYLPLLAIAIAAFCAVVMLGFAIARRQQPWTRMAPNAFIADIYRQILRLVTVITALVVALDILGATALLSTILGAAGIAGLAIGFAVKDTVENFIASVLLSIRQPFKPNDTIEIDGDTGNVIRMTARATILLSFDGNHIRIPNSTVFKSRIINYTRNDERRLTFDIGVAPDADLASAQQVALVALQELPFVLAEPAPNAWLSGIGDSTVTLSLAAWIKQSETSLVMAQSEAIRHSLTALTEAGIDMPEPTYRLRGMTAAAAAASSEPATTAPPARAKPIPGHGTGAEAEASLKSMVNEEREALADADLLNREGANQE